MSSCPPPQASQRRSSPAECSSSSQSPDFAQSTSAHSASSEDSQTVFLNHSSRNHGSQSEPSQQIAAATSPEPSPQEDLRQCWICLQNDEDTASENLKWCSPCPCNLTAHEECMLDWIADLEAPTSAKREAATEITCPQCKSEIQILRPVDYLVKATELTQQIARRFVTPLAVTSICGCLYSGSFVYGFNSMELVFGREESQQILLVSKLTRSARIYHALGGMRWFQFLQQSVQTIMPFTPPVGTDLDLRIWLGLPLIAPTLMLARTNLADRTLSLIPITVSIHLFNSRWIGTTL